MNVYPIHPGVPAMGHVAGSAWHPGRAEGCPKCETTADRAARLLAVRWGIRFVAGTGEFLVWDKTRKILRGQAVVCADEAAVLRFVENALRDEAAR